MKQKDLMVQSMHLMLLGSSVADNAYEERDFAHTDEPQVVFLSRETVQKEQSVAMGGMRTLVQRNRHKKHRERLQGNLHRNLHRRFRQVQKRERRLQKHLLRLCSAS